MKIKLWSDLHGEFNKNKFGYVWESTPDDKDTILVLAGDISVGFGAEQFIKDLSEDFKYVLYVLGNHEFYGQDYFTIVNGWQQIELNGPKNFHFLNNDTRFIDGVRFYGGTMWTNFNNSDPMAMLYAEQTMNDYAQIKHNGKNITADFIVARHDEFINGLLQEMAKDFDGKTFIISHHSPGDCGRVKHNKDHKTKYCYFACLENLIHQYNFDNWVHGHTHQSMDYDVGNTRIVCNPHGYLGYNTNPDFDNNYIIEI